MSFASLSGTTTNPSRSPTTLPDTRFNSFLLVVALAALLPLVQIGSSQFISYDGYWHIFGATQDRWRLFLSEWRADGHPPLYYISLRLLAKFGNSHLFYRSLSIVPGIVSVYLIGRVGKWLFEDARLALLAALAYGCSITMIDLFCDLRAYPLALMFVIGAFYCTVWLLEKLRHPHARRLFLAWSVLVSLGILTEYYVLFFAFASLAVLLFEILRHRHFSENVKILRKQKPVLALGLALPCLTMVWLWRAQIRFQPQVPNHVAGFYWTAGRSLSGFLWSNLRSDLNFLVPFSPHSSSFESVAAVILSAAVLYLAVAGNYRNGGRRHRSTPALILIILLLELAMLSALRRYPFGGYERQQSIIFPFVVLSVFSLLDMMLQRLSSIALKRIAVTSVLILTAASFTYNWKRYPKVSQELFAGTYQSFRTNFPGVKSVYVDQFSLIAYYIHTHNWHWRFREHLEAPQRVDVYEVVSPWGERTLVLRNLDIWNFDLLRPDTYQVLAAVLKLSHVDAIKLFYYKQGGESQRRDLASEERKVRELAANAGITVRGGVYDNAQGLLTFAMR